VKQALAAKDDDGLAKIVQAMGEPAYRGKQLRRWIWKRLVSDFSCMTDLPLSFREHLAGQFMVTSLSLQEILVSPEDEAHKYGYVLSDGESVESVAISYRYGISACLSSQVGCAIGCCFCASGLHGFRRDLTAEEILGQWLLMGEDLGRRGKSMTHVVLMGVGEPLANLDHVLCALRFLHDPERGDISYRRMAMSTAGLVPGIHRLKEEGLPVTLVSPGAGHSCGQGLRGDHWASGDF